MASQLSVTLQPLTSQDELGRKWLDLEQRAAPNFFLSWSWISAWLTTFGPPAEIIEACQDGRPVALGLLVRHVETRHRVLRVRQLRLHQTGRDAQDEIWIEYNGLLLDRAVASEARQACIAHLLSADPRWDELVIGVIDTKDVSTYLAGSLRPHTIWQAASYGVDLDRLRAAGGTYIDSLSRNTRQQVRRAIRLYGERGGLSLERARTTAEALQMLAATGELHRERWREVAPGRGFANPQFVAFHENLVRVGFPNGEIELVRCCAGGEPLAYLYNFIKGGRVYFYLSGLRYEADAKAKPGLVSHALCIQQHLEEGAVYYDFMGGTARYKESLGERVADMVVIAYQRPRVGLRLEDCGRALRQWLNARRGPVSPGKDDSAATPSPES